MTEPALQLTGVSHRYGPVQALHDLSFSAVAGAVTALLGPNGAGKSTTLRLCEGFMRATSGTVRVLGFDPFADPVTLRPLVGVMLQAGGLPAAIRPMEALKYAASLYAQPHDVATLGTALGIDALGRTQFRRLSGGEQRRLALAIALVGRPKLLILDEPTSGMDPQSRRLVWDVVQTARDQGTSVVLSTHFMDEAQSLADAVVIIDHGHVIAEGTPEELTSGGSEVLTFTSAPHLPIDSLRQALPATCTVAESPAGRYSVSGSLDASVLASVTAWCASHNAQPHDLAMGRRSLEDVFLELTGRELRA